MYRYILRESCSQFDSLPLTSLTIPLEALLRAAAATLNLYPDASAAAVAATAAATEQLDEEGRRALCWRRSDGASVVHCAALGGHRATMETALRSCAATRAHDRAGRGALAWQMNDGASPLHVAAFVSSASCVASLLKAGADPLALGLTGAVAIVSTTYRSPRRSPLCLLRLLFFFVQRGKDASQGWAAVLGRQARWRRGRAGRGAGQVRVNRRQLPRVRTWHSHPERNFWKTRRRWRRSFEFSSRQSLC